jgi:sugar lactone lactonase YvrE
VKIVALTQDIPESNRLPGVRGTVTRQDDGQVVATAVSDVDGKIELTANGAPGNVSITYLRGTDQFRDDSRSMRPFGAFSPAEFQQAVDDLIGDGVVPYGEQFAISTAGGTATVGTGAAVINGVLGVWYTSTTLTPADGARACAIAYTGTGVMTLVDVAAASLTADHLALYTYTVSAGTIASVSNVMTPILEGIVVKKPTLQSVVRAATGDTSNASGEASGNEITFTLASGVAYDIEATASVISRATAGAIAIEIDGNLSSYAANGGDITTTITNGHTRNKTGGSCLIKLYERSDTALTSIVNDLTFGSFGTGNDNFNFPQQVAVDSSGNVYIADYNNGRLKKHNSSGTYVGSITGLSTPTGVAVDSSGNIYTLEYGGGGGNTLNKYNSSLVLQWTGPFFSYGQHAATNSTTVFVTQITSDKVFGVPCSTGVYGGLNWGSTGSGDGQFNTPVGIATDGTYVYVADYGNKRIQKFTTAGVFVAKWGTSGSGNGQFLQPAGVAISPVTGNILVTDTGRDDIQEFTSAGTFVQILAASLNNPTGIAINSTGSAYVTDTGNNRVKRYTTVASSFTYDSAVLFARAIPR